MSNVDCCLGSSTFPCTSANAETQPALRNLFKPAPCHDIIQDFLRSCAPPFSVNYFFAIVAPLTRLFRAEPIFRRCPLPLEWGDHHRRRRADDFWGWLVMRTAAKQGFRAALCLYAVDPRNVGRSFARHLTHSTVWSEGTRACAPK